MEHQRYYNCLRRFRRERGLTQKEVAKTLGLQNSATISRWEKGVVMPETLSALKLSALYRTSVDVIYHELRLSLRDQLLQRESDAMEAGKEDYE